jgi:thiol-disulfide isomerase/thioredoxin
VKNFDSYPGVVDSITGMSLAFLECYTLPLPEWFVLHEKARLRFKSGFIKHNCLLTKEFYEARIVTKSPSYFDFDKALSLRDSHIVLCSEYLWYAHHRLHHYPKGTKPLDQLPFEYHIIDSLLGSSAIGDMLRMAQLSMAVMSSLPKFRDQLAKVNFGDSTYRMVLDSLVKNRLGIPTIGKLSPDPLLSDDKGNRVQLSKYKGNVLLVNFWATWCGPCIREFPFENEIHQKYKGRGFVIVNICVESEEEKWKALTKEHELKMVNLFYSPDEYHLLRKAFDLGGFPRSVLIDKDFVIRENYATRASSLKDSGIENWIAGEF